MGEIFILMEAADISGKVHSYETDISDVPSDNDSDRSYVDSSDDES